MERKKIEAGLIVFDLDGTLIDSSRDIAFSANETLKSLGLPEKPVKEVVEAIGWGVMMLLEQLMPGRNPQELASARERFLGFYGAHLTDQTVLYPGVPDTLAYFRGIGKKMSVVTNKPEGLAVRVIEELGLAPFFDSVVGGDTLPVKKPDPGTLLTVIAEAGGVPSSTVMVGDSPIDCETGNKAGVKTIGVTYGFRGRRELEVAGCALLIERFPELKEVIA